jgi:hypothetical protein
MILKELMWWQRIIDAWSPGNDPNAIIARSEELPRATHGRRSATLVDEESSWLNVRHFLWDREFPCHEPSPIRIKRKASIRNTLESEQMRAIKELENRMPESQTWRDEIIMAAMQWPKGVRAYKEKGYWRLLGASDAVVAEFVRCAERIQQESGFPRGEASPTDSLLERLKT